MTQEEKILLLQDLCGRLPYGVIVDYKENEYDSRQWKISTLHAPAYSQSGSLISTDNEGWIEYEEYKGCGMSTGSSPLHIEKNLPFLRPMSSMTVEEDKQRIQLGIWRSSQTNGYEVTRIDPDTSECYNSQAFQKALNFLLKNHFDIFGLIPKGLAIAVTEENNPYNKQEE